MKVYIPHAGKLSPLVRAFAGDAEPVRMIGPGDYPDFLQRCWTSGEPFALVEHDVVLWPGALEPLCEPWTCDKPWCGYSYEAGIHRRLPTFGCVRFSAELIAATPGVFTADQWRFDAYPRDWRYCDQQLAHAAWAAGFQWHQHFPAVTHAKGLL